MTAKDEMYGVCEQINNIPSLKEVGTSLKIEHENDFYYVRIYREESCINTLFGGDKPAGILKELRAFRRGLFFVRDHVDFWKGK